MGNNPDGHEPNHYTRRVKKRRRPWFISYVNHKLNERRTKRQEESATEKAERRTANATWFIGFFTVVVAIVGTLQFCALQKTNIIAESSERAWIAPLSLVLDTDHPPMVGQPLRVNLLYENIGKGPALNIAHKFNQPGFFEPPPPGLPWQDMRFGVNTTCDGLITAAGGPVVFPSGHYAIQYEIGLPNGYLTDAMIRGAATAPETLGKPVLFVQGCFAYETVGQRRISAYCFFLFPQWDIPIAKWNFRICTDGNEAD
jgi:hypothetical protein